MSQSLKTKANFDLAGLPLDDIYSESMQVGKLQMKEKLQYFNKLYSQQNDRILNFDRDILLEHDKDYINETQEKKESESLVEESAPVKKE